MKQLIIKGGTKPSRNEPFNSTNNTLTKVSNDTDKEVEIQVWIEPVEEKKKQIIQLKSGLSKTKKVSISSSKKSIKNDTNPLIKLNLEDDSPDGDGSHMRDCSLS